MLPFFSFEISRSVSAQEPGLQVLPEEEEHCDGGGDDAISSRRRQRSYHYFPNGKVDFLFVRRPASKEGDMSILNA